MKNAMSFKNIHPPVLVTEEEVEAFIAIMSHPTRHGMPVEQIAKKFHMSVRSIYHKMKDPDIARAIKLKRAENIRFDLPAIDDALTRKAKMGDIRAIELIYERWDDFVRRKEEVINPHDSPEARERAERVKAYLEKHYRIATNSGEAQVVVNSSQVVEMSTPSTEIPPTRINQDKSEGSNVTANLDKPYKDSTDSKPSNDMSSDTVCASVTMVSTSNIGTEGIEGKGSREDQVPLYKEYATVLPGQGEGGGEGEGGRPTCDQDPGGRVSVKPLSPPAQQISEISTEIPENTSLDSAGGGGKNFQSEPEITPLSERVIKINDKYV